MRKFFIGLFALTMLFVVAGSPGGEATALAQTKKRNCSCKPTLSRAKSKRPVAKKVVARKPIAAPVNNLDSQEGDVQGGTAASVVGPVYATYTLPQNTYIRLRMNQTLSSETARAGDRFTATVITPVYAGGVEVVPAGATVEGRVTSAVKARSRSRKGELAVAFDTLVLPDGVKKQLDGELSDLQDEKAGDVDSENGVSGRDSDERNVKTIGGGGIGGAILGGVLGGGKGAAIGGAIGAGAGVAGVMLSKGHEAVIKGGSELGLHTSAPIEFTVRADRDR